MTRASAHAGAAWNTAASRARTPSAASAPLLSHAGRVGLRIIHLRVCYYKLGLESMYELNITHNVWGVRLWLVSSYSAWTRSLLCMRMQRGNH